MNEGIHVDNGRLDGVLQLAPFEKVTPNRKGDFSRNGVYQYIRIQAIQASGRVIKQIRKQGSVHLVAVRNRDSTCMHSYSNWTKDWLPSSPLRQARAFYNGIDQD